MDSITLIKDLKIGLRNVNLVFIVLDVGPKSIVPKDGQEVRNCKVADATGCVTLCVWGHLGSLIKPGDICRLNGGHMASWRNIPTLYVGKTGELTKSGEFCLIFNEANNMSETLKEELASPVES